MGNGTIPSYLDLKISYFILARLLTLPKISSTQQAKFAYVYVRQSSMGQVLRHAESTDLQYRLVEHAVKLGWP